MVSYTDDFQRNITDASYFLVFVLHQIDQVRRCLYQFPISRVKVRRHSLRLTCLLDDHISSGFVKAELVEDVADLQDCLIVLLPS